MVTKTPEAFEYDTDGNLTRDGLWTYTWDAENRLITMETRPDVAATGALRRKLEFAYDALGRRVQKKASTWTEASYAVASDTRFIYDGWNLLSELNARSANEVVRTYVWGLDLSGTMQGAGGVGGLLMQNAAGSTYFATYDGNGNVLGLVESTTGTLSAEWEYDAFGGALKATGAVANSSPFTYSTKYTDPESQLLYYGFRYYNPATGRWLSRDPIQERGGVNLYAFIRNRAVNTIDVLGLVEPALATDGLIQFLNPVGHKVSVGIAYGIIKTGAELNGGMGGYFSKDLLWRWLDGGGDMVLTDDLFKEHAWGYGRDHTVTGRDGVQVPDSIKGKALSLRLSPEFMKDLAEKCKCDGNTFSGTYRIQDYANTNRTLGHFLWQIAANVTCRKNTHGSFGFEAEGSLEFTDSYDYKPGDRIPSDERAVKMVRELAESMRLGRDFNIYSKSYRASESWNGVGSSQLEINW